MSVPGPSGPSCLVQCLCICPSVRPDLACLGHDFISHILTLPGTNVNVNEAKCHTQEWFRYYKDVVKLRDRRSICLFRLSLLKRLHWGLSGCVTHDKTLFSKTYIFLLPTYLVYQNLFCDILICPLLTWQLGLKCDYICWTGKSVAMSSEINRYNTSLKLIANR